jgi:hypothetical protein
VDMPLPNRKLTLEDIKDVRAYEKERDDFRQHVIVLKKKRRVAVGPFVTLLFENRDTMRFQIQEMARVEKIFTDEGIDAELKVYNPLIPEPGNLSATLFVELTSETALRDWLPRLVGIERAGQLRIGSGEDTVVVAATPDAAHDAQLTRDDVTASVHYIGFSLDDAHIRAIEEGAPVRLAMAHPEYEHETVLAQDTIVEFLSDLR